MKEIAMTPQEINLVQSTFAQVVPIKAQAAELFYGRLFEIAPEAKPMFTGDMDQQGEKLMMSLAVVVNGLENLDTILPAVKDLAVRHVEYGAEPEHYPLVGAALLWTLSQGLGDGFTPEVESAWTNAYGALSSVMIEAAYPTTA